MTATIVPAIWVPAAQRPDCVVCGRPYGRRRRQTVAGEALVVCDQCWRLAGGAAAVEGRIGDGAGTPALALEPAAESLVGQQLAGDELHPVDRILVEAGVRWKVLRRVIPAARVDLALAVAARDAPEQTKRAAGPAVWMAAVEARIRDRWGTEFRRRCRQRRYWHIANVFRQCADRDGRPLTWVSQAEIAAAIGCSTKTVQRCEQWLQREGLLWEVVPGCRLPMCAVPEGETPAERGERQRRLAEAVTAEEAACARAREERESGQCGKPGVTGAGGRGERSDLGADGAEGARGAGAASEQGEGAGTGGGGGDEEGQERPLLNVVPVYELRVPIDPAEVTEAAAQDRRSAGERVVAEHRERLVHPRNAGLYDELIAIGHDGGMVRLDWVDALSALICGNAVGLLRTDENVYPPEVAIDDQLQSSGERVVDKGRASRGSSREELPAFRGPGCAGDGLNGGSEGPQRSRRPSRAVRAAEWLLRSRLDPRLCEGVSIRYLAAQIRGSHLLDRHGWTEEDLADLLHGVPEHTHLPHEVRNARAWIRARFLRAQPLLAPAKLRLVERIERGSRLFRERRHLAREEEIKQRRAAIDACDMCDELGWLHVPAGARTPRCTHERDTGGW